MNWLMLSCRKATELTEKESLTRLKATEKIQLLMHTSMCDACSIYYKQSRFIDQVLKHLSHPDLTSQGVHDKTLSKEAKEQIINSLERH